MFLIKSLLVRAFGVEMSSYYLEKPELEFQKLTWSTIVYRVYLFLSTVRLVLLNMSALHVDHESQLNSTFLSHNHLTMWTMGLVSPKYVIFIYSTLTSTVILIEVNKVLSKRQIKYLTCVINPLVDLEREMESDGQVDLGEQFMKCKVIQVVKKNYWKLDHLYSYLPVVYAVSVISIELVALAVNHKNSVTFSPSCLSFATFILIDAYFIAKNILTYVLLLVFLASYFIAKIDHLNDKIEEECRCANKLLSLDSGRGEITDQMASAKKGLRDNLDKLIQIITQIRICSQLFKNQLAIIIDGLALAVGLVIFVSISIPMSLTFWIHGIGAVVFASELIIFIRLIARIPSEILATVNKLQFQFRLYFSNFENNWCPEEKFKFNYQLAACIHKSSFTVTGSDITHDYIRKVSVNLLIS